MKVDRALVCYGMAAVLLVSSVVALRSFLPQKTRTNLRAFLLARVPGLRAAVARRYGLHAVDPEGKRLPLPPTFSDRELTILVHGLDEPGTIWRRLIPALHAAHLPVLTFTYPNDQPIHNSAAFFLQNLRELRRRGVRRINLVTHSMGGLVARDVLGHPDFYAGHRLPPDRSAPEVARLIMIVPPNQGSWLVRLRFLLETRDQILHTLHGDGLIFGDIVDGLGGAGDDLLPQSPFLRELARHPLPTDLPCTIVAARFAPVSYLGLERYIGDVAVPLPATRLAGVTDWTIVPGNHLSILVNPIPGIGATPTAIPLILSRLQSPQPVGK